MINKIKNLLDIGVARSFIAKELGVAPQTIGRWLSGTRTPTEETERNFQIWLSKYKEEINKI